MAQILEDIAGIEELEALSAEQLDELDLGVIRMAADSEVVAFNTLESELSGLAAENVLGRNMFVEIGPCMNNFMVAEKYLADDDLDEIIDYVFTYRMKPTPVRLRMLKKSTAQYTYLVVERRSD